MMQGHHIWAYCITVLLEKNSGYFNRSFLPMVKSMVNSCLPEFSDLTRVFSPVKMLCNGPHLSCYEHEL